MPSSQKRSYGPIVQTRARRVLKGILEVTKAGESSDPKKLQFRWQEDEGRHKVTIETTLQTLMHVTNQDGQATVTTANVRESLEAMRDFLRILQDHRVQPKGKAQWDFTISLWSQDIQRNLNKFDELWENKRSLQSKSKPISTTALRSNLEPSAPFRWLDTYVKRPKEVNAVKRLLLNESETAAEIIVISGMGGLGKSVLATELVLDPEIRTRFPDGILWVTLGQNPNLRNCLNDWIRALDKSRGRYSATTLESTAQYLQTLLLNKRMLLVVDDVWNAAYIDLFRVRGGACRILVTTQGRFISGAERHDLDLMSPQESLELIQKELGEQWDVAMEQPALEFANLLGRLPLALRLMAVQISRKVELNVI